MLVFNSGPDKLARPVTLIAGRDIILDGSGATNGTRGVIGTEDPTPPAPPNVLALIAGCNIRIRYERNYNTPPVSPGTGGTIPEPDPAQQQGRLVSDLAGDGILILQKTDL